jgi:hypothetical protein
MEAFCTKPFPINIVGFSFDGVLFDAIDRKKLSKSDFVGVILLKRIALSKLSRAYYLLVLNKVGVHILWLASSFSSVNHVMLCRTSLIAGLCG